MASWSRLGMNLFGEWIEEDDNANRRILSVSGYLPEPSFPDLRWGRVTSPDDAVLVAEGLSRANIFNSYGSLSKACAVWTSKKGSKTPLKVKNNNFKVLVEKTMATRVWRAVVKDCWSDDLPAWSFTLNRVGLSSWPLAIDIGIYRKTLNINDNFVSLDDFKVWLDKQIKRGNISIEKQDFKYLVVINKEKYNILNTQKDLLNFAGDKPKLLEGEVWSDTYIPFSSTKQEESSYSGYVDPLLYQAMLRARPAKEPLIIRKELADLLSVDQNELDNILSDEQLDAIYLAYQQLSKSGSFLLADETGYGKGRILASIAKIALKKGIKIIFITEKKALLSDFYRDCLVIFGNENNIPTPCVVHSTAKVLNPEGESVVDKKYIRLPQNSDKWVWTTYSQFNRAKPEKLNNMISWIKTGDTWILMDEAQNAAGDSKTGESLKKFTQNAKGVVYSSATYAKREEQLEAYKNLFTGSSSQWFRLKSAFSSDNDTLRTAIALAWAQDGIFLRREHPPMENPLPFWIKADENIIKQQQLFALWWIDMIRCAQLWTKALGKGESPWSRLGGSLSRASREFSLLQKKDHVINFVLQAKANNEKAVIVSDWTLTSHMQRLCSLEVNGFNDDGVNDEVDIKKLTTKNFNTIPLWKDSWSIIIDEMFSDDDLMYMTGPVVENMKSARDKAKASLAKLPNWSVSPFDDVMEILRASDIKVAEISGRQLYLVKNDDKWTIKPRPEDNRVKTVNDFNSGQIDVVLLTRAGNSGISLHAGRKFLDQRQRHLLEWDVSPDPSVRLQFWGRVRRKDQVCEPLRSTLLIDSPSERRRLNRDAIKQKKISSHSGFMSDNDEISWIGREGTLVAQEWISNNPTIAKAIGASYDFDVQKALLRSVVLNQEDQYNLMTFLDRGVSLFSDWSVSRLDELNKPSHKIRKQWWWGQGESSLYWQERVWPSRRSASKEMVFEELSKHSNGFSQDAKQIFNSWRRIWNKWWIDNPSSKTSHRRQMLDWWLNNGMMFDRGRGVEVKDPNTGAFVRGIILGFEPPNSSNPQDWSASQIGMWVWLVSMTEPMKMSLSAWMSEEFASLRTINNKPQASWFKGENIPTKALVLTGPSWSVAAWGIRHAPKGRLIHMQDEYGVWEWGWMMPEWWTWQDMLLTDRELSGVEQAMLFLREKTHEPINWRWSDSEVITIKPSFGGLTVSGNYNTIDKMSFQIQRKCGSRMKYDDDKGMWSYVVPWKLVRFVFMSWFLSGAIPTVSHTHKDWHKKKWLDKK